METKQLRPLRLERNKTLTSSRIFSSSECNNAINKISNLINLLFFVFRNEFEYKLKLIRFHKTRITVNKIHYLFG